MQNPSYHATARRGLHLLKDHLSPSPPHTHTQMVISVILKLP